MNDVFESKIPFDVYKLTKIADDALYRYNNGEDWKICINNVFCENLHRQPTAYDIATVLDVMPTAARMQIANQIQNDLRERRRNHVE